MLKTSIDNISLVYTINKMTQNILIVGKVFRRLTNYLTDHGFEYCVLADSKIAKRLESDGVICDFSNQENYLKAAEKLGKIRKINAVISTYENYILPAAQIAEHLNLPGLPINAAIACTDKQKMRELFANCSENISPEFKVVENIKDLQDFAKKHSFPLILKPANLAKSLLVTKNHDLTELLENYETTISQIDEVYRKYAPHSTPKILIEEFLEGSIHSVDAFIGQDGDPLVLEQVVDYQTGYDVGFDDNFHYSRLLPSKLPQKIINDVRRVAKLGCKSLGMKNTPAHIEIILTKNGPKIVEIGARNGGYRERMHSLANGIDITGTALNVALGKPFNIIAQKNEPCAVLELFPKISGEFSHLSHQQELEKLPSLSYFNLKAKPGEIVGKSSKGHKMCAVITLHNKNTEQFNHDLEFVNKNVYVVTNGQLS